MTQQMSLPRTAMVIATQNVSRPGIAIKTRHVSLHRTDIVIAAQRVSLTFSKHSGFADYAHSRSPPLA